MASPRSATASSDRSREERYARLAATTDPNASREQMQARIAEEFGDDPGFEQAYKESVKLDGRWYDLVGGYEGPNAAWHGMMLKEEGRGGYGSSFGSMSSLGYADSGYGSIPTPAAQGMPAMARPQPAPLPTISRVPYVRLAAPRMSDLAVPEAA